MLGGASQCQGHLPQEVPIRAHAGRGLQGPRGLGPALQPARETPPSCGLGRSVGPQGGVPRPRMLLYRTPSLGVLTCEHRLGLVALQGFPV